MFSKMQNLECNVLAPIALLLNMHTLRPIPDTSKSLHNIIPRVSYT